MQFGILCSATIPALFLACRASLLYTVEDQFMGTSHLRAQVFFKTFIWTNSFIQVTCGIYINLDNEQEIVTTTQQEYAYSYKLTQTIQMSDNQPAQDEDYTDEW